MFRRLVITITMLLALPAFANATWYVTASKSGGDATCTVSPASSTIPGFSGSQVVTVAPGAGYQVNKVTVDGATQTLAANGQYTINYTAGKTYRTLVAYFGTAVVPGANITVTPPANSTYRVTSPVNGSITNITLGSNRTIAIIPVSGYAVSNVVVGGAGSAACVVSDSLQFAGAKDVTCTNIQAAITIGASSGVSQTVSANAGPDRTVSAANSAITLNGSGTFTVGPATYAWTKVSGPGAVTFGTAAAAATTFSADAAGTYVVQLQVSAAGATAATDTATIVVANATQTAESVCTACHTSRNPDVVSQYDAGVHKSDNVSCQTCHDPSNTGHYTVATPDCATCHSSEVGGFTGSTHWTSATGAAVPDMISHGTNCTQTCHFRNANQPGCYSCHSGKLNADGTFAAGIEEHKLAKATAAATCMTCHEGGRHGVTTDNWLKSSHNIANNGFENVACDSCHNPHSTVATATDGKTDSCSACHKYYSPTANYSIYTDATYATLKAPHGGGVATSSAGGNGTTQYLTQGAICSDCHGHNNTINAGYAESAHGAVSSDPMNPFAHYDWSGKTNNGTRQNGNCDRCHTTYGFLKFANQTTGLTRLQLKTGQPNNVLICVTCHGLPTYDATQAGAMGEGGVTKVMPEGTLRLNAAPAGSAAGALKNGYFALFSSNVNYGASGFGAKQGAIELNKSKIQIQFPGFKNSGVCIPCHSGRSTDQVFVSVINRQAADLKNYSTIPTSYYQHGKNIGQTFIGVGGYDFTGNLVKVGASAHNAVKMGASDSQGPCVGCHYSTTAKTHSLEVDPTSATCVACHSTTPNVAAAKANFDAGVKALDALIRLKFNPLRCDQAVDLSAERANVRFGRFNKAAGQAADATTAKNAYGAWYNWQILATYDNAAYAHNPAYARILLNDTLEYLNAGQTAAYTIANINTIVAAGTLTGTELTDAGQFLAGSEFGCVGCHAVGQNVAGFVNDNNGVRAIMPEFTTKRSHHITGGAPTNAQCAVCHLEGTAGGGVNPNYHMKDAKIHLRNCNPTVEASTEYVWDPATPNHTAMDNFCFSCHNAAGATAAVGIVAGNNAGNPFGDTLTNGYDQVARARVVDVKSAFTSTNASHHAVSGQRYKYRFSTAANAAAWAARNSKSVPAASQIAVGNLDLDGNAIAFVEGEDSYDPAGPEKGGHATLYEADKFVATYIPLGATENVADNSTLHCGDCHTVGQWKSGVTTNAAGETNTVAIGTHGSANDYLLRNSLGTDALHSSQTYVCFNCHTAGRVVAANDALWNDLVAEGEIAASVVKPTWKAGWNALHPNVLAGQIEGGYVTAHAVSAMHAQCQADSSNQVGNTMDGATASRAFFSTGGGHKDRTLDFLPASGATAALPTAGAEGGNVTGIACINCHNSGLRKGWGGIHGGNNTYTDGLGRAQTTYRFMPGMGNYRYAPPGGWDGKNVSDPTLVTQAGAGVGAGKPMGGCYTGTAFNGTDPNTGFSACQHHGTSTAKSVGGTVPATFRTTYGGGTTATPTAAEPTVREATAGGTLVTRPLKY
jgi:Cytochrome c554 and c-prime